MSIKHLEPAAEHDSTRERARRVLTRALCITVAMAVIFFAPVCLYDAYVGLSDASYAVNCSAAAAEEAENEKGDPKAPSEATGDAWGIDYRNAADAHKSIFKHLRSVIDEGDIARLIEATNVDKNLQDISDHLDKASTCEERRAALDEVAQLSAAIHEKVRKAVPTKRRGHILYRFEPTYVARYRGMAYKEIEKLEAEVRAIRTELEQENPKIEWLAPACARACGISRLAYVFAYTVSGSRDYDKLRATFLDAQIGALEITRTVSRLPGLESGAYDEVRSLLDDYQGSMLRRLQNLP